MAFALHDRPADDSPTAARVQRRTVDIARTARAPRSATEILALQRAAGNKATSGLLNVQRCGSIPPDECPCHDDSPSSGPKDVAVEHVNGPSAAH